MKPPRPVLRYRAWLVVYLALVMIGYTTYGWYRLGRCPLWGLYCETSSDTSPAAPVDAGEIAMIESLSPGPVDPPATPADTQALLTETLARHDFALEPFTGSAGPIVPFLPPPASVTSHNLLSDHQRLNALLQASDSPHAWQTFVTTETVRLVLTINRRRYGIVETASAPLPDAASLRPRFHRTTMVLVGQTDISLPHSRFTLLGPLRFRVWSIPAWPLLLILAAIPFTAIYVLRHPLARALRLKRRSA